MANIYRDTYTKPLPPGAETFTSKGKRAARWTDGRGKTRTAPLSKDGTRIVLRDTTYTAKFRAADGTISRVPTGCRDETAARAVLGELVRRAELVRANVIRPEEDAVADAQNVPLSEHFENFGAHLRAGDVGKGTVTEYRSRLRRVAADCGFSRLADLDGARVATWLAKLADAGSGAAVRNHYRKALVSFGNWAVRENRLAANPFSGLPVADEKADRRRQRRALTEGEIARVLAVAQERPLRDAATCRQGERKGQVIGKLRDATRSRLAALGKERALIYKTLFLTGLRRAELASLTVGALDLASDPATATLAAGDEKNRKGSILPLRADLAEDLRQWIGDRLNRAQWDARRAGNPIPDALPAGARVFRVPAALVRILDRDLVAAGIARRVPDPKDPENPKKWRIDKRDERGRTVDVHALRTSLGTHLSRAGVPLRTAQAVMRHSRPELTANVYTDPKLLDVAGALDALPELPLTPPATAEREAATGTLGRDPKVVTRIVTNSRESVFTCGNSRQVTADGETGDPDADSDETRDGGKTWQGVFTSDNNSPAWAIADSNRKHHACKACGVASERLKSQDDRDTPPRSSDQNRDQLPENPPPDPDLALILRTWPRLSPAKRGAFAAMFRAEADALNSPHGRKGGSRGR